MTSKEIKAFIKGIKKGTFGTYLVVKKNMNNNLLVRGKALTDRLNKVTFVCNARITSFDGMIDARIEKGTDYDTAPRKGFEWVIYPMIERSLSSGKEFFTFNYTKESKTEFSSKYLLDGNVVTDLDTIDYAIKGGAKKKSTSSPKQSAAGIAEKDQVKVARYAIEDIEYIGFSKEEAERVYKKLTE